MIFDLRGGHLGDVMLAMPAMRVGDGVIVAEQHRIPGLDVTWLDAGKGVQSRHAPGLHMTKAWTLAVGREPIKHRLLPRERKLLLVIAPDVDAKERQWDKWGALRNALPGAVWITGRVSRRMWMWVLNAAHTVICPDTGTAHMADALGARVIGLYGRTFQQYAPTWDSSHCIARDRVTDICVEDVLERLHV
ncbi:glycosyltransferase family 9 protein [Pseudoxanthomonas sp.]|uniref:glycosyltransferase family 9 protein n=1 Tax=Pseudoxanthomonas sp. TaxID=1871049 RepID=UPI00261EA202|nr:glycosyltransferase family 9 protein [Pseudoxanthomonas sp.]WDS36230.1 MAG: glycosyltransferase family 9 protein [Pseudoxanthomonas sp.]